MSPSSEHRTPASAPARVLAGTLIALLAWLLPVSLKSVSRALLKSAGAGTPSVGAYGRDLVDSEKIGPAKFFLEASRSVGDPAAGVLEGALADLSARQPTLVAWGGWDASLDPLFNLRRRTGRTESTPVLTFLVPTQARDTVRAYLANSGSIGVQDILRTRDVTVTGRFVPANRPGGQPLDALILLTGLLYQGERMSPPLQREVRSLAESAVQRNDLGPLEDFYMDVLSLGRRLDWTQLCELVGRTDSVRTVGEFAHLARVAPDQMPFIYSAALLSNSADRVASYLIRYGKAGSEDLRIAIGDGQGAVNLLLQRQVPVNHAPAGPGMGAAAALVLEHPRLMLAVKYAGYLLGLFLLLQGLDTWIVAPAGTAEAGGQRARAGILAVVMSALLIVATEPFLLKAAPPSEYMMKPVFILAASSTVPAQAQPSESNRKFAPMETSTLVSIAVFAALQVGMYLVCLRKIREIDTQDLAPLLKLRLMENEENLFDSGLYVGMMGTAAALVLQVLGVIEPNLLAAYSSNLFGIICVALVKIRHVRAYRTRLIMETQRAAVAV
ncbi:MAG TPA: hypothetical protein VGG34_06305 [Opitutaceae bacterium]|jgi:hypothetical protein